MNKNGVILLSGGLDSACVLYLAKSKGYKLTGLIFDYQQRHKKELECAKKLAGLCRIPYYLEKIDLSWTKSSLTKKTIAVPKNRDLNQKDIPVTYVAARNIIFLSYAFSLAESIGAQTVFIGAHCQDYSGYPDCRPEFLWNFAQSVRIGLKDKNIRLAAPLIDKSKKDIVAMGIKLKVPFKHTWSCYQGLNKPCEVCDSCKFRANAFKQLGMIDPLLK